MKIQDIKQRNTKGMFGWYSQELKKKILKTCLIEKVIFVFLVLHVLKMTFFREQKNGVLPIFFIVYRTKRP